jgi:hypothetical protein
LTAAPQPVERTERAQPKTKPQAGSVKAEFEAARKSATQRTPPEPAPQPKKSKRGGDDERRFFKAIRARDLANVRASLIRSNTLNWLDQWCGNAFASSYAAANNGPDHPLQQEPSSPLAPSL